MKSVIVNITLTLIHIPVQEKITLEKMQLKKMMMINFFIVVLCNQNSCTLKSKW